MGKIPLKPRVLLPRRQNMNNVMAGATKRLPIVSVISIERILSPRFRVMNYTVSKRESLATILTSKLISSETEITPLNIKYVVPPLLSGAGILLSTTTLSSTLSRGITFVRTGWRTILTFLIILVTPKSRSTAFTVLKKACLSHHYDVIMGEL